MKKILIITAFVLLSATAWADFTGKSNSFIITADSQNSQGLTLVHVAVKDSKAKSGVCPYFVKSLEYLEAVKILSVELFQETCLNDSYGFSKGEIFWVVPKSLQSKGQPIQVLINQTEAGTLVFDEIKQSFSVKGAQN